MAMSGPCQCVPMTGHHAGSRELDELSVRPTKALERPPCRTGASLNHAVGNRWTTRGSGLMAVTLLKERGEYFCRAASFRHRALRRAAGESVPARRPPGDGGDAAYLVVDRQVDGPRLLRHPRCRRRIDLADPAPVAAAGTEKAAITHARPPRDAQRAEVHRGLRRRRDVAPPRHAVRLRVRRPRRLCRRAKPLDHPPGTVWNYSSGTTNILCRILGDLVGGGEVEMRAFLDQRLFGPCGMFDATPSFDAAGTWVGSSYVHAPGPSVRPVR